MATNPTATTRHRRVATPKRKTVATRAVDSARFDDLNAALANWNRIAVPVAEPDPCPLAWCVDCINPATVGESFEGSSTLHRSAKAVVETLSYNDRQADEPSHDEDRIISVNVERGDLPAGGVDEPTAVHLYLGRRNHLDLGPAKARDFVAALQKAQTSAVALELRDGISDGDTGAVSVLSCGAESVQVGAVFTSDGAVVFVNTVEVLSAADVRSVARRETPHMFPPNSWDLTPAAAVQLATAMTAAAQLVDADRRVSAAPTCPPWCAKHMTDPDGSVCHEGAAVEVTVTGDENLVGGVVSLKLNRFDEPGRVGIVAVCLQSSQDGIDLSPAELRTVAAIAEQLADTTEVTR